MVGNYKYQTRDSFHIHKYHTHKFTHHSQTEMYQSCDHLQLPPDIRFKIASRQYNADDVAQSCYVSVAPASFS